MLNSRIPPSQSKTESYLPLKANTIYTEFAEGGNRVLDGAHPGSEAKLVTQLVESSSYSVNSMWFDALPPKGDFHKLNPSSPEQTRLV